MRLDMEQGMAFPANNFSYGQSPTGWYCLVRFKWWTKIKELVCPWDFDVHSVEAYPTLVIYLTTYSRLKLPNWRKTIRWQPTDEWVWEAHTHKMIQQYVGGSSNDDR